MDQAKSQGVAPAGVQTAPGVVLVNPKHPRAGVVSASHYCFAAAGIQFQCYRRNTFEKDTQTAIGVKNCLRVVGTVRHGRNSYGSPDEDAESVQLEVAGDPLLGVAAVLAGERLEYALVVPRPGHEAKMLLVRRQPQIPDKPFYIEMSEGNLSVRTSIPAYHAWSFRMVVAHVLALQFPALEPALLLATFTEAARFLSAPAERRASG